MLDKYKISTMKQTIRLTESEMNRFVAEAVTQILNEGVKEGWFGDKWNQVKSAATTAVDSKGEKNLRQRFDAAKKNWNTQGELNNITNLLKQLTQFVDAGQIDPNITIAQLIGGKYNNTMFGKMTGKINNRKAQIAKRGGKFYEEA